MPDTKTRAFTLGVVSGMRAALGPALVSHQLSQRRRPNLGRLNFMRSDKTAVALKFAAAGELVGDKLPMTPNRTEAGGLAGRALSGALCGAALSRADRHSAVTGAALGALGAVLGTFAFYHLRRTLTHEHGLPDAAVALAEDALAFGAGRAVLRR